MQSEYLQIDIRETWVRPGCTQGCVITLPSQIQVPQLAEISLGQLEMGTGQWKMNRLSAHQT